MRKTAIFLSIGLVVLFLVGIAWAQREFYGTVQTLPAKGYVGQWVVDGKAIQVVDDSKLKFKHGGKAAVGSYVKVEGINYEGKFVVDEIETVPLKR